MRLTSRHVKDSMDRHDVPSEQHAAGHPSGWQANPSGAGSEVIGAGDVAAAADPAIQTQGVGATTSHAGAQVREAPIPVAHPGGEVTWFSRQFADGVASVDDCVQSKDPVDLTPVRDDLMRAHEEGIAAPDVPTRLCPHCAALSQTSGDFCPHCGSRFIAAGRAGVSTRVKVAALCVLAVFVLGGAGVGVAIKVHHDNQVAAQHRQAAAAARAHQLAVQRAQAARRAQQAAQQAQRAAEISQRQSLEGQLQTAITNDATQKAYAGVLFNGPALSTTCTPISGGSSQDLSRSTGTYSCLAIYQNNGDGTSSGYGYTGIINFDTGNMTWQLSPGQ